MVCDVRWYIIILKERYMLSCNQVFKNIAKHMCVLHVNTKLQLQKKIAQ
jgi:hypothetical protein